MPFLYSLLFLWSALLRAEAQTCTDIPPPDSEFSCPQQKRWGKCDAAWMRNAGYCARTCGFCSEDGAPTAAAPDRVSVVAESAVPDDANCHTVRETLSVSSDFSLFLEMLLSAVEAEARIENATRILEPLLDGYSDDMTLFVPINAAFNEPPDLTTYTDIDLLTFVEDHLVASAHKEDNLRSRAEPMPTVGLEQISTWVDPSGELMVSTDAGEAIVVFANVWACHAFLHFIDGVLSTGAAATSA